MENKPTGLEAMKHRINSLNCDNNLKSILIDMNIAISRLIVAVKYKNMYPDLVNIGDKPKMDCE